MLAVKSICLLPYLFKAFSRYSWIHFNLGSMHTCLLLLLSLALPKEKSQSESGAQSSSAHPHPVPDFPWVPVLLLANPWAGWVISPTLKSPLINIPGLETICLLWQALVVCTGNHVRVEQTQNLDLRLPMHTWTVNEFSANNRKNSFGNTDMVNIGNFCKELIKNGFWIQPETEVSHVLRSDTSWMALKKRVWSLVSFLFYTRLN